MATLLSQEWVGGRLERTWAHDGKITVEVQQDVDPVFDHAKMLAQTQRRDGFLRFKGHVPGTMLEEACRIKSKLWGIPFRECFREVMEGKTGRAKSVWRTLTEGRDFAKLQARYWR
jgi:hypothetical protein